MPGGVRLPRQCWPPSCGETPKEAMTQCPTSCAVPGSDQYDVSCAVAGMTMAASKSNERTRWGTFRKQAPQLQDVLLRIQMTSDLPGREKNACVESKVYLG